ncbi:hypothetical protein LEP1GSC170_2752, partial [Leptospira interrogans serovar Bataviae str. HAI135]
YRYILKMWELTQIQILQIHSENVGTNTNSDFTDTF